MAQLVDPKLASDCIRLYEQVYQSTDTNAIRKAYTSEISFSVKTLNEFLQGRADTDKVCIKLGVYTPQFVAEYADAREGRLSAFLCLEEGYGYGRENAAEDGGTAPITFNLGDLAP